MTRSGDGLHTWPAGSYEKELRKARRQQIREARRQATVEIIDGRRFKVLRLPDSLEGPRDGNPVLFHRTRIQRA